MPSLSKHGVGFFSSRLTRLQQRIRERGGVEGLERVQTFTEADVSNGNPGARCGSLRPRRPSPCRRAWSGRFRSTAVLRRRRVPG